MTLPEDFSEFTPEVRAAAIGALAGVLDIPRDQIRILDVQPGSIILKLEIPSESLDKLIALYEDNDPAIRGLGIYSIIEELSEEYVLINIRSMLIDMFSLEEIRTFCYEKFRNVYEHINSDSISKKEQIADMIVGYAHQESCIPVLLDYSHEFHRDIYYKHTPYHNVPRKPEGKEKSKAILFGLSTKGFIKVTSTGLGISTFGTFAMTLASTTPLIGPLVWIALAPLGATVGGCISKYANYRNGQRLALLSLICYLIGCNIGPIIGTYILIGNSQIDVLTYLLWSFTAIFYDLVKNPLSSIGLASGGYFAYSRVR